ncbi:cytochrome P450, partial [Meira miltonrushii]
ALYTTTLLMSIAIYRLFFHKLRKYPGPITFALTKWTSVPMDAAGERPHTFTKLHDRYGDIVRVGPRELSINDPNAVTSILGGTSKCVKGPWYQGVHGGKGERALNLHVTMNPTHRRQRRRIWDQAFSVRALQSYEEQLLASTRQVMQQLNKLAGEKEAVPVDQWCCLYSFDIMGELGFSRSFNMVQKGKFSNEIHLLESFMSAVMIIGNVPYLSHILRLLPNPLVAFDDYTEEAVKERVQREKNLQADKEGQVARVPDVFSYLLEEDTENGWKHTWKELIADAQLLIVAGSDTSSSTLSLALYNLATNRECLESLRKELEQVFGKDIETSEIQDFDALNKDCPYLNAVINETMRLFPPVASGVQRVTPNKGQFGAKSDQTEIKLRNKKSLFLPPGTVVSIPTSLIQRDPRNFSPHPNNFRPERWISPEREEAFEKNAFVPFGYGPSGCVGKSLAYMEMRLFLAQFVMQFDIRLAENFDQNAFLDGIKDTFTMTRQKPLNVQI